MVDTTTLQPGDKVRIIDMRTARALEHTGKELYLIDEMEEFFGTVMTVRYVVLEDDSVCIACGARPLSVFMEEDTIDDRGFFWVPETIAEVVSKREPAIPSTESEIASFIGF